MKVSVGELDCICQLCVVIIQVCSGLHKITAGRRDRFSFRDVGESVDQVRVEWGERQSVE